MLHPVPQETRLSRRETEILKMIAEGLSDKEIAARLGIRRRTVSNHVSVILVKLNAANRAEAVRQGLRLGLMPVDPQG